MKYRYDHKFISPERRPWFWCACCPSNLMRLIGNLQRYAYDCHDDTLFINTFVSGDISLDTPDGVLKLAVETEYPYGQNAAITVSCSYSGIVRLGIHIPEWTHKFNICINNETRSYEYCDGYAYIQAPLKENDRIELSFSMEARYLQANRSMWDLNGRLAIAYGPLIYCVEGVDNDGTVAGLAYNPKAECRFVQGCGILEDERILITSAYRMPSRQKPYEAYQPEVQACKLTAVPYFAWNNRSESDMDVWLPYIDMIQSAAN